MSKAIAFHLQKGGVGKTTISGSIACQSALQGAKTLLIDVDPQGNISSWFLTQSYTYELSDVLQGTCFPYDAIIPIPHIDNLSIIPTFGIGGELKHYAENKIGDEPYILQDLVSDLSTSFDRIILDLSPGLGKLERSALIASDEIVTPMTPEIFSLDGLEIFITELDKIKKNFRSNVVHRTVVINSYDGRITQHKEIYRAALSGLYSVYKIPVDPIFRKSQEAHVAPQVYKIRGRGLKQSTIDALVSIDANIWRN